MDKFPSIPGHCWIGPTDPLSHAWFKETWERKDSRFDGPMTTIHETWERVHDT